MRSITWALMYILPLTVVVTGCASRAKEHVQDQSVRAAAASSGAVDAKHDIQRGHLELRGYGLPATWLAEYRRLLAERLGVEHKSVAGCVVSEPLIAETRAYNEVMVAEIERRFGGEVLSQLQLEARRLDSERRADPAPTPVPAT